MKLEKITILSIIMLVQIKYIDTMMCVGCLIFENDNLLIFTKPGLARKASYDDALAAAILMASILLPSTPLKFIKHIL